MNTAQSRNRVWMLAWGALVCLAVGAAAPGRADACSFIPVEPELMADRVPLDGPLVVDLRCMLTAFCETESPAFVVTLEGTPVAGSVEYLRGDQVLSVVWTPDQPLSEGSTYRVTFFWDEADEGVWVPEPWSTEIVARAAVEWPDLALDDLESSLETQRLGVGTAYCCESTWCGAPCYTEQAADLAVIRFEKDELSKRPFSYRMRWVEADGHEVVQGWTRPSQRQVLQAIFQQPAATYCATLEMRDLVDGTISAREHCADADPSVAYAQAEAIDYKGDPDHGPRDCAAPPGADPDCDPMQQACATPSAVLFAAWCESQHGRCAQGSAAIHEHCERVASYCGASKDVDAGPTYEEPDAGPTDHVEPDAGVPVAHADAGPHEAKAKAKSRGCAVTPGADAGHLWTLLFSLLWLQRRRVRSRR